MIGHMTDNTDLDYHKAVLNQGVYDSLDRLGLQKIFGVPLDEKKCPVILKLIKDGNIDRLLLSHDSVAVWLGRTFYGALPENGQWMVADNHPSHLFEKIIPMLKEGGISDEQIRIILEDNPRNLFEGN
jgi:phosphotriesterase-related protein